MAEGGVPPEEFEDRLVEELVRAVADVVTVAVEAARNAASGIGVAARELAEALGAAVLLAADASGLFVGRWAGQRDGFVSRSREWVDALVEDLVGAVRDALEKVGDELRGALDGLREDERWSGFARKWGRVEATTIINWARFRSAPVGALVTWRTRDDDRVRASHRRLDGEQRTVGDTFLVGGVPARFPGDPRLPIGERINCRCRLVVS